MNDKDKEAFEAWWREYTSNLSDTPTEWDVHDAWQAACEYKDKEQYIEGSIHESGGIKREMTWKESSDMMESRYLRAVAQLDIEYKRIRELQAENKEWREAARSEAEEVDRLQTENSRMLKMLMMKKPEKH